MIRIIQNLRIGTKLAITSLLSILLIAAMLFAQVTGNAASRKANDVAIAQQTIARDAVDTKASARGMESGVRDVRLATNPADLQKASNYVAARLKSVNTFSEEMSKLARSAESRERIEKLKVLVADYAKLGQQIAAIRAEAMGIEANKAAGELPPEATAKLTRLNEETGRITQEGLRLAAE